MRCLHPDFACPRSEFSLYIPFGGCVVDFATRDMREFSRDEVREVATAFIRFLIQPGRFRLSQPAACVCGLAVWAFCCSGLAMFASAMFKSPTCVAATCGENAARGRGADRLADADGPVFAVVGLAGATVHSGPGQVHYATDQLALGAEVEIHRLDPGGWCAIAPPRRSFSIVSAEGIEQRGLQDGVVVSEDVRAWVGTLLGDVDEPLWQVRLEVGESVKILGYIENPAEEGAGWFQIAPPNGEFRWIQMEQLTVDSQQKLLASPLADGWARESAGSAPIPERQLDIAAQNSSAQSGGPPTALSQRGMSASSIGKVGGSEQGSTGESGWQSARTPMNRLLNDVSGHTSLANQPSNSASDRGRLPSSPIPTRPITAGAAATDSQHTSVPTGSPDSNRTADVASRNRVGLGQQPAPGSVSMLGQNASTTLVESLELALSLEMTRPPQQWDFQNVRTRATMAWQNSRDAAERAGLRQFLDKLDAYAQARSGNANNAPVAPQLAGNSPGNPGAGPAQPAADPQLSQVYDAMGTLEELVRDGGLGETTYVLRDANGRITHHIQATPGLNLHRYLKQRLGIVGQRGYNQNLQLNHVTASRIVELDRLRR